jgi:hypothetical protein
LKSLNDLQDGTMNFSCRTVLVHERGTIGGEAHL